MKSQQQPRIELGSIMSSIYKGYARVRLAFEQYDALYPLLINLVSMARPLQRRLLAKPGTDIVIEGFPRSANTFFCSYFIAAQSRPPTVAHHLHSSYQLRAAARWGLPCVFLVRDPVDCLASALLRDKRVSADILLKSYIALYRTAARLKDRLLVVSYKLAIGNPNAVIDAINEVFGCSFEKLDADQIDKVYERIHRRHLAVWNLNEPDPLRIGLPSSEKDEAKRPIAERVKSEYAHLVRECDALFRYMQGQAIQLPNLE